MLRIRVSQLHENASEVLRDVREHGAMHVVTKRGKPVATILPLRMAKQSVDADSCSDDPAWDHFWEVSERMRGSCRSPLTAEEIMKEMRRSG